MKIGLYVALLVAGIVLLGMWDRQVVQNAKVASLEQVILAQTRDKEASDAQEFAIRALEERSRSLLVQLEDSTHVCLGEHDTVLLRNLWP